MINLASKYSEQIAGKFTRASYVAGNASTDYEFSGARYISVYTPQTVGLNDYVREGQNRFGTPLEMQDTVQEMMLSQDKGFAVTIDKGNNMDQMNVKGASHMLNLQIKEQVVPYMDRYALSKWANEAGTVKGLSAAPTKATIVEMIFDGAKALDDGLVPDEGRVLYIPTTYYNMLRQSDAILAVNSLNMNAKALEKGVVGMIADMKVVKVPDVYLPGNVYFLITHKSSVLHPNKIQTARVLTGVQGIDGAVLEGRNYFDAFVLGAKCMGVYAAVKAGDTLAAPSITLSGGNAAITAASGSKIYYTLDGSDPRYSARKELYTGAVAAPAGTVVRAYAEAEGKFRSPVA
ncbi:MAG TPA: hypothetical protein DEB31_00915 [Clostridiales bacterium]|nr:hypothetical protein [Clostridiales bacterium]